MKIITDLRQLNSPFRRPVAATIGIFDGVHLGHQRCLKIVRERAKRIGGISVVVTFDPHPRRVLGLIGAPPLLVSLKHRLALIENAGIDVTCVLNFNEAFSRHDPESFVRNIIVGKLHAVYVIIGSGFRFGNDQSGDIKFLERIGKRYGFGVKAVPLVRAGGRPVSSTRIRDSIIHGRLKEAALLLGRPVSILGTVIKGAGIGRRLGYPTANINPHHEAIPPCGVYAVYAVLGGKKHKGILNIGFRPTFNRIKKRVLARTQTGQPGDRVPSIEVHILGLNKSIYGREIEVQFMKRLRDEMRFKNKEKLISQIRIDERDASVVL